MTHKECEVKILELLKQIADVCNEFRPGMGLCLCVDTKEPMWWAFSNEEENERLIDVCHFSDGTERFGSKYVWGKGR